MQLKNFLYKLFYSLFFLFFYNSFLYVFSMNNINYYNFSFDKKYIKNFILSNKNECCFFLKSEKIFLSKKKYYYK